MVVNMLVEVFALSASFLRALGPVLIRRSLDESNFLTVSIVITVVGDCVIWPLALQLRSATHLNPIGALLFLLAGALQPGLVRLFYLKGMSDVGVSITASIFATLPVLSTGIAIIVLNERPTFGILIGIFFVVSGGVFIQGGMRSDRMVKRMRSLIFPLSATLAGGSAWIVRKIGLNIYDEPIIGVALGYLSTTLIYILLVALSPKMRSYASINIRAFKLFWKAGLCLAIGWILAFYAVRHGDIAVVTSLIQVEPLFILILAHYHLRKLEAVSSKTFIGALSIVAGAIAVTIS